MADFARFVAVRGNQERDDTQALSELQARPLALPPGLELEWLGVSGYRLTYQGATLFIDPYVSRVPLSSVIKRTPTLPDPTQVDRYIGTPPNVVGVLIGHTHWDHAVDAPEIARRSGCPVYGSSSLVKLMALHGIADQAVEVQPYQTYELGPFAVSFTPSLHSKLILGFAVPFAGEFTCDHLDALSPSAYKCGQVWGISIDVAGVSFYHQGSANLVDDALRTKGIDFFLAGIAGRGFTDHYWERILRRLEPKTVIPTHYDDFFKPLDQPMGFTANVNLAHIPDEVARVSRDITVAALPPPA